MDRILSAITRRIQTLRGAHRLSEWLRRYYVRRYSETPDSWTTLEDYDGDLKLKVNRATYIGSKIYWHGKHSRKICLLLDRKLASDWVFLDVGANQGEVSVFAAKRLARGNVLSFEPIDSLFAQLQENLRLNGFENVRCFNFGLSDHEAEVEAFGSSDSDFHGGMNEGLGSVFQAGDRTLSMGKIKLRRLDDVFPATGMERLDLIKVDVEGSEWFVLKGAEAVLSRYRPKLILEINEACFHAAGYTISVLRNHLKDLGYSMREIREDGTLAESEAPLPPLCDVYCE